jgi:ABC-type lipoprotein release transport system permease subunit
MLAMLRFRPLPWEYGVRNLLRRPGRSALTLAGLTIVVLLVLVVAAFVRGLETTLAVSGDPRVAIIYSLGASEAVEYSSVSPSTVDLVKASVEGIQQRYGQAAVSGELYLGTQITPREGGEPTMGLVRGVTPAALLVRSQVQITEGAWPLADEVLVGRLAAAKLGWREDELAPGSSLVFEGRTWRVSGTFTAGGSAFESEMWCQVADLQQAMKRQDLSLVAVKLNESADFADVNLFCKENRRTLEIESQPETTYYASLRSHYSHIRVMAWIVVGLIAGAGVFAGLNTMYGAVVGRIRELATLQTLGFLRRAIAVSLMQEGTILAAAASLIATIVAVVFINGWAVRFTMGAFALRVDSLTLLIGCLVGLLLGPLGALPASARALRGSIVDGLKSV